MDACLIVFPAATALDTRCPRCGCDAGEHPAPMDLLDDPETPVIHRPTLREATR
jgi:hypothetical protein